MNFSKKNVLILTDGSEGMNSQVEGLAKHFNQNFYFIKTKLMFPWSKLQPGFLPIFSFIFFNNINLFYYPDIIISCGRKSVYFSIYLKKKYKKAICIHIQNPKINFEKFDYIVTPNHDNVRGKNIIESIGALHKFDNNLLNAVIDKKFLIPKNNLISLIIGGSNNHYNFSINETKNLADKVKDIKKNNPEYNLLVLYSRRTTQKMKKIISNKLAKIAYIWDEKNENPYTYALKNSKFFIVTSDSTSMISECAFTGKSIYIFHLPFKRISMRMKKFHYNFENLKITKNLNGKVDLVPWKYNKLNEAERIAGILKERIIKEKI